MAAVCLIWEAPFTWPFGLCPPQPQSLTTWWGGSLPCLLSAPEIRCFHAARLRAGGSPAGPEGIFPVLQYSCAVMQGGLGSKWPRWKRSASRSWLPSTPEMLSEELQEELQGILQRTAWAVCLGVLPSTLRDCRPSCPPYMQVQHPGMQAAGDGKY